ncbi:hypothetical protein BgiBS90_005808, partial [Biomphalaria glabrata]
MLEERMLEERVLEERMLEERVLEERMLEEWINLRKTRPSPAPIASMTSPVAGSLSPAERHRSVSPRSDFLAIPEFGSPNYPTSASSPTSLSVPGSWWGFGSVVIGGAGDY